MRFCMVTTFYPPYSFGGDATYVRALSRGLVARGHEVEVVHCTDAFNLLNGGPPAAEPGPDDGVVVHRLKSHLGPLSPLVTQQTGRPGLKARALKSILAGGRFDVVNFHNISLVGGPGVLKYSRAPATLYTLHEHWLVCPTHILWKERNRACDGPTCLSCCVRSGVPPQVWRYTGLIKRALEHVDLMIAPSRYTAGLHVAAGLTQPLVVTPLFSAFEPRPLAPPSLPRPRFLFVGRVTPSKGIEPLARTFAAMSDADLVVVGEGDALDRLKATFAKHPNISFVGRLPQAELARHYAEATALVLPSLAPETFGLAIVEAAAFGTPALVRAGSGGAPETIAQSGGGLVYADEAELVTAARWLADDKAMRDSLGAKALEACRKHHTLEAHLDRYEELVEGVLSARSVRSGAQ